MRRRRRGVNSRTGLNPCDRDFQPPTERKGNLSHSLNGFVSNRKFQLDFHWRTAIEGKLRRQGNDVEFLSVKLYSCRKWGRLLRWIDHLPLSTNPMRQRSRSMKVDGGGSCSKLRIYFALDTECSFNGIRKMFHLFMQLRILMFVPIPEREGAARVSSALRGNCIYWVGTHATAAAAWTGWGSGFKSDGRPPVDGARSHRWVGLRLVWVIEVWGGACVAKKSSEAE